MKIAELDFDLPQELIASEPVAHRSDSRLMTLAQNKPGAIGHHRFDDIVLNLFLFE